METNTQAAHLSGFFIPDSDREKEVKALLAKGYSPEEVAALLSREHWEGFSSITCKTPAS